MALNTAPSFMNPAAKSISRMASQPQANRVAAQRAPNRMNSMGSRSGMGPMPKFGTYDGAKSMGNLGNNVTKSFGYNPTGMPPMSPMGGGGMSPMRTQAPPLMDSGMVGNNAPPMDGPPPGMPPGPMGPFDGKSQMGGGYDGSGITGGMPPGVFSEAYGGDTPPMEIGGMRNRVMDPRFRY